MYEVVEPKVSTSNFRTLRVRKTMRIEQFIRAELQSFVCFTRLVFEFLSPKRGLRGRGLAVIWMGWSKCSA